MSMDLHNNNGHFPTMGTFIWGEALKLAQEIGGWEPMGVQANMEFRRQRVAHLPEAEQEKFLADTQTYGYTSNDGDIMLGQDATNLAIALASIMDDIPFFEIPNSENAVTRLEYFSGPKTREWLKSLIVYLRDGGDVVLA